LESLTMGWKLYRRGTGRAILYAHKPPASASGHNGVMEGGVSLHAAYEIRLPDDVLEAYPVKGMLRPYSRGMQKGGLGFFAAAVDGAFSATPAFKFVPLKVSRDVWALGRNWTMVNAATGEAIGTYEDDVRSARTVVAAAGVDAALLVVYASLTYDYFKTSPDDTGEFAG
jgi:hypothetical protein